jgi:hypothetical protein
MNNIRILLVTILYSCFHNDNKQGARTLENFLVKTICMMGNYLELLRI